MQSPYPSRYRVIERGRRLITIDTLTGEEVGGLRAMPAPPSTTLDRPGSAEPEPASPRIEAPQIARAPLSETVSALSVRRAPQKLQLSGKLPLVVAGGIALIIFLIVTNLWIFVVIAFLVPQIRAAVFAQAKTAIAKLKDDQAATG